MNDPNWDGRAFDVLVDRLRKMGATASTPLPGDTPDVYVARLLGWVLDVTQASEKAKAAAYWQKNSPAFRDVPPQAIETPRAHVAENGRSYKIEGAVQDGKKYLPGEPLPPKDT
jgi:hypothetical protein